MDMFEKEAVVQASILPIMLLFALIAGLAGPFILNNIEGETIYKIDVLDMQSKTIRIVDDKSKLSKLLGQINNSKKTAPSENFKWTYKLVISGSKLEGQWLYNPATGQLSRLNQCLKSSYNIIDTKTFNKSLGIKHGLVE